MTEQFEPLDETTELSAVGPEGGYERFHAARVNLLPPSVLLERRQRRVALYTLGILVAFVAGLGAVYAYQVDRVNDARDERDRTEAEVAVLRDEIAALAEYQELLATVENREVLLTSAMDNQLSWARILGDLALQFDRQASLIGVNAASTDPEAIGSQVATRTDPESSVFDLGEPVAEVQFTGYSIDRFAPGVEEVLKKFEDASGFHDAYLSTAGEEERGTTDVTNFVGAVLVDDSAYTHRYDDGLPEETQR